MCLTLFNTSSGDSYEIEIEKSCVSHQRTYFCSTENSSISNQIYEDQN
jgi:hypothetical protein